MNRHLIRSHLTILNHVLKSNTKDFVPTLSVARPFSVGVTSATKKSSSSKKEAKSLLAARSRPRPIRPPSMAEFSYNPPDARNQPLQDGNPLILKRFNYRTGHQEGGNVAKKDERVMSSGTISNAAQKIKPDDSRDQDDGSLELKEELSPGTANKQELAKHANKQPQERVPKEVRGKIADETAEMLKNESGMSSPGAGG